MAKVVVIGGGWAGCAAAIAAKKAGADVLILENRLTFRAWKRWWNNEK